MKGRKFDRFISTGSTSKVTTKLPKTRAEQLQSNQLSLNGGLCEPRYGEGLAMNLAVRVGSPATSNPPLDLHSRSNASVLPARDRNKGPPPLRRLSSKGKDMANLMNLYQDNQGQPTAQSAPQVVAAAANQQETDTFQRSKRPCIEGVHGDVWSTADALRMLQLNQHRQHPRKTPPNSTTTVKQNEISRGRRVAETCPPDVSLSSYHGTGTVTKPIETDTQKKVPAAATSVECIGVVKAGGNSPDSVIEIDCCEAAEEQGLPEPRNFKPKIVLPFCVPAGQLQQGNASSVGSVDFSKLVIPLRSVNTVPSAALEVGKHPPPPPPILLVRRDGTIHPGAQTVMPVLLPHRGLTRGLEWSGEPTKPQLQEAEEQVNTSHFAPPWPASRGLINKPSKTSYEIFIINSQSNELQLDTTISHPRTRKKTFD